MIALDVETSGIDPTTASILSLGAIDTDEPTNQFYDECRAWDGALVADEALAVNGFSREEAHDGAKKSEAELIQAFIAWALDRPSNHTFVSQNAAFDRAFVEAACRRASVEHPFAHRALDTHTLVWLHMRLRGSEPPTEKRRSAINLTYALAYCGLPEEPTPHNALTGAECHAEIFARIAYTKSIISKCSSYPIPLTAPPQTK